MEELCHISPEINVTEVTPSSRSRGKWMSWARAEGPHGRVRFADPLSVRSRTGGAGVCRSSLYLSEHFCHASFRVRSESKGQDRDVVVLAVDLGSTGDGVGGLVAD